MKHMKHWLITVAMLLGSVAMSAQVEIDGIYYSLSSEGNTAEVISNPDMYSGDITIPSTVYHENIKYSVTSIGSSAFSGCSNLVTVIINEGVKAIGSSAFSECSNLVSITIPSSVELMGTFAFSGSTGELIINSNIVSSPNFSGLENNEFTKLTIGEGVTSIGKNAFYACYYLTYVTIPSSVTSIGDYAFRRCCRLISINLPENVTSIGERAFSECTSLNAIKIPSSVTSIGQNAFYSCSSLNSIVVANGNMVYDSRNGCNAIIETGTNTLVQGCSATIIPEDIVIIGEAAFVNCINLSSITIPKSVTCIKENAFCYNQITGMGHYIPLCNNITSIKVEEGNTVYDSRNNCNAIIETSTNTLLKGCSTTIIPESAMSIGYMAFYGCSSLTSITIPESVTSIAHSAFYGCNSLTTISIPASVTSIGSYAFCACSNLTSIDIAKKSKLVSLGSGAFDATPWYNNQSDGVIYIGEILYKYKGTMPKNTTIKVKEEVILIASTAFNDCSGLVSITFPNSVANIGSSAFSGCI